MSIFRTIHVQNNNKVEKFHDSKELAIEYLTTKAAIDLLNKVPNKGLDLERRAKLLSDNIPAYLDKLDKINDDIQEFKPAK